MISGFRESTVSPEEAKPFREDSSYFAKPRGIRRPEVGYLSLAAATILCLLPFSGRAFHTDDSLFIWAAQNISKHFFDPYGFNLIWELSTARMSEVTQNPPLASYYMATAAKVIGWSERALHLAFLLPTIALVLGVYRLARRFTKSPGLAAVATLMTPALLVSACSTMCDPMMLALWIWATIFWLEGLDAEKPILLTASVLLVAASELTKYFGAALVFLLFAYSLARRRRVGSWAWYLLFPVAVLVGYEFLTARMYGHGLLSTAADFSRKRRLWTHASKGARALLGLSYVGGCTLPALLLAPLIWSRKQVAMVLLASGVATVFIMRGLMRLGVGVASPFASSARSEHWAIISAHLSLFIAGGISMLAMAIADYRRERDADSLFLLLWVAGTFWFTAYLNWTMNARSVLPMVPAMGILLARRLQGFDDNPNRRLRTSVAVVLIASGEVSLYLARADTELANSARTAALLIHEKTIENGQLWFVGHSGFQYYMQNLGARPHDWRNPQTRPGDWMVIPYSRAWPAGRTLEFLGPRQDIEIPIKSHASTISHELGACFYYSYWSVLPYAFGPVPQENYAIVRLSK